VAEGEEVLGRHGLEHADVLDHHVLDGVHSFPAGGGPPRGYRSPAVPGRLGLVDDLLEPQLVGLVGDDEQGLVVGGRIGEQHLQLEQLRTLR
jgi:hypothetical protein